MDSVIDFSWDIFDGLANRKITQNTKIQIESNKLQLDAINLQIEQEFNSTFQQYINNVSLIDIEKRNLETSEKFFERAKEQFYQGQLSRNDFRLAQTDLSMSKNRLNQTKYKAKIAEKKIFLEKSISEAMQSGAEETVQKLRQQVAEEITSLENKAEREKESIHEQK